RHPCHDLPVLLNPHQRPKRGNTAREFLRAVNRINDHARAPVLRRRLRAFTAHLFAQHIQRQTALRHLGARHRFHLLVRLRYRRAVHLSLHAHFRRAKIPARNRVRLLRNRFQQRFVFLAISHGLILFPLAPQSYSFPAPAASRRPRKLAFDTLSLSPLHTNLCLCLPTPTREPCWTASWNPAAPGSSTASASCRKQS